MAEPCPLSAIVSDDEVDGVFAGTNFGESASYRAIIADTLLKVAGDYSPGYTAIRCCMELGLLVKSVNNRNLRLTQNGRKYLFWSHYSKTLKEGE